MLENELAAFNPTASFYMSDNRKGEVKFRIPLINLLTNHVKGVKMDCAHAHSPGLTSWMMADGMLTDHAKIARLTVALMDVLSEAERIRVTSPAGTDITLSFNHHRWIADHMIPRGTFGNLPCGEIYTCPEGASGKIVVDGELGDYFEEYGELDKTPVEIIVGPDGRAQKVSCANKRLEKELWKYLKQEENADRVGELGIPTNMDLKVFIRNLLQDEKAAVHIAFGDTMKEETGADWDSKTHLDCLMRNCTVDVSVRGKAAAVRIMEGGEFTEVIMRRVEELRLVL